MSVPTIADTVRGYVQQSGDSSRGSHESEEVRPRHTNRLLVSSRGVRASVASQTSSSIRSVRGGVRGGARGSTRGSARGGVRRRRRGPPANPRAVIPSLAASPETGIDLPTRLHTMFMQAIGQALTNQVYTPEAAARFMHTMALYTTLIVLLCDNVCIYLTALGVQIHFYCKEDMLVVYPITLPLVVRRLAAARITELNLALEAAPDDTVAETRLCDILHELHSLVSARR
jgi:hypothetical protein